MKNFAHVGFPYEKDHYMLIQTVRFRRTILLCFLVMICFVMTEARSQTPDEEHPTPDDTLCELIIEGEDILSIALIDRENGMLRRFSYPGESLELPAGNYVFRGVVMTNGYEANLTQEVEEQFELTPGEPYVLQAGGPLHPSADVQRSGAYFTLDYIVVDAAGREYEQMDRNNMNYDLPPRFVVYDSDGKEVGSGAFNYG